MKKKVLTFGTTLVISTVLFSSCALMPDRTYSSQMGDDEDSEFMVPGEDFPIVAGDTGSAFRSRRQILKRTPATGSEREKYYQEVSLEDELERLVEEQSEEMKDHYRLYEYKLATTSEKIYFLKLDNMSEREEYLESKGIVASASRSLASSESSIGQRSIVQGMSKSEVAGIWGQPYSVEVAGNPKYENERWIYKRRGQMDYVYFESGKVDGWKKNR
ncbi:MAG: hypothetical protein ACOYL6_13280 [Bacteriovoracaceae bacterium]